MSATPKPQLGELRSTELGSGVNEQLEPFLTIRTVGVITPAGGRVTLTGQLSPKEVREMALSWLEAAEAAESDALVAAELIEGAGLEWKAAAAFLVALRERRGVTEL